jgi:hypothetical protein
MKERVVTCLKVLPRHSSQKAEEENHEQFVRKAGIIEGGCLQRTAPYIRICCMLR